MISLTKMRKLSSVSFSFKVFEGKIIEYVAFFWNKKICAMSKYLMQFCLTPFHNSGAQHDENRHF